MEPARPASPERVVKQEPRDHQWFYLLAALGGVWLIVWALTGEWNTYRVLDDYGWIEHNHDTPVWIQGEWLTDEYRVCEMPGESWGELPASAHLLCGRGEPQAIEGVWPAGFRDGLSVQESIQLQNGHWAGLEQHFHVLPVEYWGKIDRTDRTGFSWRCQKKTSGLECKAMN
jgi:hypothetical protein